MLKELVRERLIAAADDIYVLFETTMASYKEQLCRAREETERHRRQLEAVCKAQIVVRVEDVEQLLGRQDELSDVKWRSSSLEHEYPQFPHIKEEEEEEEEAGISGATSAESDNEGVEPPEWSQQEEEEEAGISRATSAESDNEGVDPPEWSQLHHGSLRGRPLPDNLLTLLSDGHPLEEPLGSGTNCEDLQQLIGDQEELPSQPLWGLSGLELEHLQHPHFEEEADVCKLPLTGVAVKSEDETPEWSQLHGRSPGEDRRGGLPQGNLLAPMSDSDDNGEPLRSDTDCESDDKGSQGPDKKGSRKRKKRPTLKEHFSCSVCGKRFTCKSHWMRHTKTHTGEKSFCCSVCGKTFSRKEHVELHMRTHTGEKPFRCSICSATFSVKQSMKKHMRRHTGEKPFSCSFCRATFSRKESLDKHMRVHTGEKPFSCSVCGGSFAQRSNMTRHMQIHKKAE
ncbi:uncharacterized protein ACBT44_007305 isoform 1-T1 [Syngnathus typhle]